MTNAASCKQKRHPLYNPMFCACGWSIEHEADGFVVDVQTYAKNKYEERTLPKKNQGEIEQTTYSQSVWIVIISGLLLVVTSLVMLVSCCLILYKRTYMISKAEERTILGISWTSSASGKCFSNDAEKIELSRSKLEFDDRGQIGGGESGTIVLKGTVQLRQTEDCAAIKVYKLQKGKKPSTKDFLTIRNLVSEAKILCYLGEHENIVGLFGVCTANLRRGEVLLALEYCSFGSIRKYLVKNGNIRVADKTHTAAADGPDTELVPLTDLNSLIPNWCFEISNGMNFLASKQVVHADLATRNVLLDSEKRAKISDFGLSRRMENQQVYVKQTIEPLPWRWMAPESLLRSIFNEKTDVWSFGVTIWEMYTFGGVPYGGMSWKPEFAQMLANGLRLDVPETIPDRIMGLVNRSWSLESDQRPDFSECKRILWEHLSTPEERSRSDI